MYVFFFKVKYIGYAKEPFFQASISTHINEIFSVWQCLCNCFRAGQQATTWSEILLLWILQQLSI